MRNENNTIRLQQISFCALCVVASRLVLTIIGLLSQALADMPVNVSDLYMHWDGVWYTSIVTEGYHLAQKFSGSSAISTNLNFFPLFPVLAWPLSQLFSPPLAAQAVANVCFFFG